MKNQLSEKVIRDIVKTAGKVAEFPVSYCQDGRIILADDTGTLGVFLQDAFTAQAENRMVIGSTADFETMPADAGSASGSPRAAVYYPVRIEGGIPVGVLLIEGNPGYLQHLQVLIEKTISIVLRDNQVHGVTVRNQHSVMDYIMQAMITGEGNAASADYIKSYLASRHLKNFKKYRIILVRFNSRLNPSNLIMLDQEVYGVFDRTGSDMYTFRYPNEYVLMLEDSRWQKSLSLFQKLAERNRELLQIAAGEALMPNSMPRSYRSARLALHGLKNQDANIICYEDLNLELILRDVGDAVRDQFVQKNLGGLGDREMEILHVYYRHNMSLKEAADDLIIHRNTLQYQLDRIRDLTGLDPRSFQDAVILYLALRMKE